MYKRSITFGTQQRYCGTGVIYQVYRGKSISNDRQVHVRTVEYFLKTVWCHTMNGVMVILTLLLLEGLCQYWVYENLYNITLCLCSVNKLVKLSGSACLSAVATYNNFSKLVWAHESLSVL